MIHHEKKARRIRNLAILDRFKPNKEVRVFGNDQAVRKGIIEFIEGKLIKVNYARANADGVEDGLKTMQKLEELFMMGEVQDNEVQEEFVP